ncbi:Uncharacterised protein [Vibrio cholerae]|nr:Uncharacterised protein [Vibrio cholerae]CSD22365.1 Uncharacterised protein [Vibrio cholerae]CSE02809.1 Uncharacterised protein [Vibrio cholerae]CSH95830.1 Uncharacterised protein [Vibrio cholerae]CSI67694.1 Uncharacterised protein [Vibrio cholerae]
MNEASLMEAHFMLGWMHVDIHLMRIEFNKQHIGSKLIDT